MQLSAQQQRLKSHYYFCNELKKYLRSHGEEFDVVYSAYPLIYSNYILGKSKSKFNYKLIMDIQDVWPESITGPMPILSGKLGDTLLTPLTRYADKTYSYADGLVAVSDTYLRRADIKKLPEDNKTIVYIGIPHTLKNNKYKPSANTNQRLVAVYLGTLGGSYDLATVIKAAALCKDDIEIKIVGSGPDLVKLKNLDQSLGNNVEFLGSHPYDRAMEIISESDIVLNPIKSTAQQSMTNKLSDYLSSGIPILSCQTNPEVVEILKDRGNFIYQAGDHLDLAKQLKYISNDRLNLKQISELNFEFAQKHLFRDISYKKIISLIDYISAE